MIKGSDDNGTVDDDDGTKSAATNQEHESAPASSSVTSDAAKTVLAADESAAAAEGASSSSRPESLSLGETADGRPSTDRQPSPAVEKLSPISEHAGNEAKSEVSSVGGKTTSAATVAGGAAASESDTPVTKRSPLNSSAPLETTVTMETAEASASALNGSSVLSQPTTATATTAASANVTTLSGPARRSRNESFKQFTERVRTFSNDLLRSIEMAHDIADLKNSNFSAATQSAAAQQYYSNLENNGVDLDEYEAQTSAAGAVAGPVASSSGSAAPPPPHHRHHKHLPKSKSRSSEMSHHYVSDVCSEFDEETHGGYSTDKQQQQPSPHLTSRASLEADTIHEEQEDDGKLSVRHRAATISVTGGQASIRAPPPPSAAPESETAAQATMTTAAGTSVLQLADSLQRVKSLNEDNERSSIGRHSTSRLDHSVSSVPKVDTQVFVQETSGVGKDFTDYRVKTKTVYKNGVKKKIPDDIHISILEVFIYLWGVTTFFVDLISDIILAVEYFRNDREWLGSLTLMFVIIPNLTLSLFSLSWYIDTYNQKKASRERQQSPFYTVVTWFMTVLFVVFQLDLIWKYIQGFIFTLKGWVCRSILRNPKWEKYYIGKQIKCDTDIGMLRLIDVFLDSGPQVLLQLYVITTQNLKYSGSAELISISLQNGKIEINKLELKQLVSIISSLFSMGYALAGYHRCLRNQQFIFCLEQNKPLPRPMRWISTFMQFFWYLFLIAPRVLSMAIFASTFRSWFFMIIVSHWLIMYFWILTLKTNYCITSPDVYNAREEIFEKFYNFVCSFIYIFVYFNLKSGPTRLRYLIYYIIYYAENVIFGVCYYLFSKETNAEYKLCMLAIVLGGFWVAITFQVIYYLHCHPSHDIRVCVKKRRQFHLVHAKKLKPPLLSDSDSETESEESNLSVPYGLAAETLKSAAAHKAAGAEPPSETAGLIRLETTRDEAARSAGKTRDSCGRREPHQQQQTTSLFQTLVRDETSKRSVKLINNDNKLVRRFSNRLSKSRQQQVKPIVDDSQHQQQQASLRNYAAASSSSSSIVNYDNSSSSVKLISINRLNNSNLLSPLKTTTESNGGGGGAKYEALTNPKSDENGHVVVGGGDSLLQSAKPVKRYSKNRSSSGAGAHKDAINSRSKPKYKKPYSKQNSLSNNPIVVSGSCSSFKSTDSIASSVAALSEAKPRVKESRRSLVKRTLQAGFRTKASASAAAGATSDEVEANDGDDEAIELSRHSIDAAKTSVAAATASSELNLREFRLDTPRTLSSLSSFLSFSNVSISSEDSLFFKASARSIRLSQLNLKPMQISEDDDKYLDAPSSLIFEPSSDRESEWRPGANRANRVPPLADTNELALDGD